MHSLDVGDSPLLPWGPSAEELLAVWVSNVTAALNDNNSPVSVCLDDSDSDAEVDDYEEDVDITLLDTLDAADHAEAFRISGHDELMYF